MCIIYVRIYIIKTTKLTVATSRKSWGVKGEELKKCWSCFHEGKSTRSECAQRPTDLIENKCRWHDSFYYILFELVNSQIFITRLANGPRRFVSILPCYLNYTREVFDFQPLQISLGSFPSNTHNNYIVLSLGVRLLNIHSQMQLLTRTN